MVPSRRAHKSPLRGLKSFKNKGSRPPPFCTFIVSISFSRLRCLNVVCQTQIVSLSISCRLHHCPALRETSGIGDDISYFINFAALIGGR